MSLGYPQRLQRLGWCYISDGTGHEIIGRVVHVGKSVTKFKVGDLAGVGCMVDSCQHCSACEQGLEQYCEEGNTLTYNDIDRHDGLPTLAAILTKLSLPKSLW